MHQEVQPMIQVFDSQQLLGKLSISTHQNPDCFHGLLLSHSSASLEFQICRPHPQHIFHHEFHTENFIFLRDNRVWVTSRENVCSVKVTINYACIIYSSLFTCMRTCFRYLTLTRHPFGKSLTWVDKYCAEIYMFDCYSGNRRMKHLVANKSACQVERAWLFAVKDLSLHLRSMKFKSCVFALWRCLLGSILLSRKVFQPAT